MNGFTASARRLIYATNQIHRTTAFVTPVLGGLIGLNEVAQKFDRNCWKPIDTLVLCIPEMCFGCVCGYFWMYTMLPYSFYKRHKFYQNIEQK
jgi:hypothetical protein